MKTRFSKGSHIVTPNLGIFLVKTTTTTIIALRQFRVLLFRSIPIKINKSLFAVVESCRAPNFPHKDFFSFNPFSADLVTFTEEIVNGKLQFLCSERASKPPCSAINI